MSGIGKIRRSQVITTYGPGAIIDFRSPAGAPISAVSGGLDHWDKWSIRKGLQNEQKISEPRLEKKLGVKGFRAPPVGTELTGRRDQKGYPEARECQLPSFRFPNWHFCPTCDLLQETSRWANEPSKPELYCSACSGKPGGPRRQFVVPVRFVVACDNGHLEDFPWSRWCEHKEECTRKGSLKLKSKGAGLSGLRVECSECGGGRSMTGAFGANAIRSLGHSCGGKRPWLTTDSEVCDRVPQVIQRGASNAYFPIIESALSIPGWGELFEDLLGDHWDRIQNLADPAQLPRYVSEQIFEDDWYGDETSAEELLRKINLRLALKDKGDEDDLLFEEYAHLMAGLEFEPSGEREDFSVVHEQVPDDLSDLIDVIARVERLREVRVLTGFTRLTPLEGGEEGRNVAPLGTGLNKWLPASEVFGEGIFIALREDALKAWEQEYASSDRAKDFAVRLHAAWKQRNNGEDRPLPHPVSPRLLLIHTLAHAYIKRLSLNCGYSAASLRERLYVSDGQHPMAGFLIYTSAPDSDGTMGGLAREGKSDKVHQTLIQAVQDTEWCSADPLCSEGFNALSDENSLAACHACSFMPETSCELFNRYLDRAAVSGLPDSPELGYFNMLLSQEC